MALNMEILSMYQPPEGCEGPGRCEDKFPDLIFCIVVPGGVLLLSLLIFAVVLCCKSAACRCKKYSTLEPQPSSLELEDYNSIRRASATLRQMSRQRDTPMGSRAGSSVTLDRSHRSVTLDRSHRRLNHARYRDSCSSLPGTLNRNQRHRRADQTTHTETVPPPYDDVRLNGLRGDPNADETPVAPAPPPYRPHHVDPFIQPDFMQSSMHSRVSYDDSSDNNGSGVQLLPQHHRHHPQQQQQQQQQYQQQGQRNEQQQQQRQHRSRSHTNPNYHPESRW